MKLDKKAFKIQSFQEAADHQKHYRSLSEEESKNLLLHLMQASYGFVGSDWPKMDKEHFEVRSLINDAKKTS